MLELGYNIMRKHRGQELATEAAKIIVDFAAEQFGNISIFAAHAKENPTSGRVLEKLGFVRKGGGICASFDGLRSYDSWEYVLDIMVTTSQKYPL